MIVAVLAVIDPDARRCAHRGGGGPDHAGGQNEETDEAGSKRHDSSLPAGNTDARRSLGIRVAKLPPRHIEAERFSPPWSYLGLSAAVQVQFGYRRSVVR